MLKRGFFITGTDTGVGKTFVSALLASALREDEKIIYYKPVQSGYPEDDDTVTVKSWAGLRAEEFIEPAYRLRAPMSPDRAAALEDVIIDLNTVLENILDHDRFWIVEGAGGWEVPLRGTQRISTLAKKIDLPVIVVASTRLGTINHTLLTVERIRADGLKLAGVVLNGPEDPGLREVLETQDVPILFSVTPVDNPGDNLRKISGMLSPRIKELAASVDKRSNDIEKWDRETLWHPYTQHAVDSEFPEVVRGDGSWLQLNTGQKIYDAISSWWVNLHGHGHVEISRAIAEQSSRLEHVIFAGYTHAPAVQLATDIQRACARVNPELKKVFYSDNGSTAVEVALKMSYQYHQQRGDKERTRFLALRNSYHGDTLAAMSVSEREGYHGVFQPLMAPVDFITADDFKELSLCATGMSRYAACIVEPLVQGAAGMRMYSPEYLRELSALCKQQGVLLVADEVFTGFYRTGSFLASEQAEIQPDLVCLSKGITAGFLPLAVTVATQNIFEAFKGPSKAQAFLHGHSYTANPVACAAGVTSWRILNSPECQKRIRQLESWTEDLLDEVSQFPRVLSVRQRGTIGAFDMSGGDDYMAGGFAKEFSRRCLQKNLLIRPLGNTVYTVPPYSTTESEFLNLKKSLIQVIKEMS